MSGKLRLQVVGAFKMHGYTLRSDAASLLVEILQTVDEADREDCIDRLLDAIQKQPLTTSTITRTQCERAIDECNQEHCEDVNNVLTVIDAFSVPRFVYNGERKKFISASESGLPVKLPLHAGADTKAELFRERYTILHQRTSRHELFRPSVVVSNPAEETENFQLKPVEYLLGSTTRLGDIIVLGLLTQLKEGKWYLEDPTGAVQLDLTRANFHTGLFTENCFVLAEGFYEDEVFHVNAFGFPPAEPAKTTRSCFGNINFFGGPSSTCVKASVRLQQLETANNDAMFVFLSDVWLDDIKVIQKLRTLFNGYSDMPPTCFVFCGHFTTRPYGTEHVRVLKESFHTFVGLVSEFPNIKEKSQFIFVPGPRDPGPGPILPRPGIPKCVTEEVRTALPSVVFTSNPCRLQYCTQEIVVFREDIVMKMCRNCVQYPADGNIPMHFTKTIICQSHLCPLPLHVAPVYWAHDFALRMYPLPDLLVSADKYDPFTSTQVECTVTNPGSFPRSNYAFKVYWPASKQIEDCRIDDVQ